jgi:hypothetical protein
MLSSIEFKFAVTKLERSPQTAVSVHTQLAKVPRHVVSHRTLLFGYKGTFLRFSERDVAEEGVWSVAMLISSVEWYV